MLAQPQSSKTFVYVAVHPDNYDPARTYPLLFLLHGYGANMYDLVSVAPSIDRESYVYVFPNAPIPVLVGEGMVGYSWRPPRDDGGPEEAKRAQAEQVDSRLWEFFDEVTERYGPGPGNVLLAGFSQGGSMSYNLGLLRSDLFAGIAALSTGISNTDDLRDRLPQRRDQPVFIAHGLQDNPERARRSHDFLVEQGYSPEYHEYDIGHQITDAVVHDLSAWVHRILPPR